MPTNCKVNPHGVSCAAPLVEQGQRRGWDCETRAGHKWWIVTTLFDFQLYYLLKSLLLTGVKELPQR